MSISITGSSPVVITENEIERTLFYNDGISPGDYESLKDDVEAIEGDIEALDGELSTAQTDITNLKKLAPLTIEASDDSDWTTIYNALINTEVNKPYAIYTNANASKILSDNNITSAGKGLVTNVGNNTFDFIWMIGTAGFRTFRLTNITDEGIGTLSQMRNYTNTIVVQ